MPAKTQVDAVQETSLGALSGESSSDPVEAEKGNEGLVEVAGRPPPAASYPVRDNAIQFTRQLGQHPYPYSNYVGNPTQVLITERQVNGGILRTEQQINPEKPISEREGCGPTGKDVIYVGVCTAAVATLGALA